MKFLTTVRIQIIKKVPTNLIDKDFNMMIR